MLTIGHSPDPDDAFMFYPLTQGEIDTAPYEFRHLVEEIESLNRRALKGELEVSAVSTHAYAHVAHRYALLRCGASMGKGYGPILVAKRAIGSDDLSRTSNALVQTFGVPGTLTTAFLLLRLYLKSPPQFRVIPFDQILEAVSDGEVDFGLLIHEGQLTYADYGLVKVADLGEWWLEDTGLPLPLGVNVVRKDLGKRTLSDVARLMRESIDYALAHRSEALSYAMHFARGLDAERADQFVGMYVNEYTQDVGLEGERAIHVLLTRAHQEGILATLPDIEWAE